MYFWDYLTSNVCHTVTGVRAGCSKRQTRFLSAGALGLIHNCSPWSRQYSYLLVSSHSRTVMLAHSLSGPLSDTAAALG